MSEHKDAVYTAPGHNAIERKEMIALLKRRLYPILGLIAFILILTVAFYFFVVPSMNASNQHYYYHGTDEGPVGSYMFGLMTMMDTLVIFMLVLTVMIKFMDIPPKEDYASPTSGLGEVQHDEEWAKAEAKTVKMIAENFYTIIMRVSKNRIRPPSSKLYGAYDLFLNVGEHSYLCRRLRWDELTPEQQKQIEDAHARDRRNQKLAMVGGFGAGVVIGSGGSVH